METREQILAAARKLASIQPLSKISLVDVARAAGVSWPTVRRHVGGKQQLRALLAEEAPELVDGNVDTRSRILGAASQVFAERGLRSASLDEVAAGAGLTKGAVYWHFRNKDDLILALMAEHTGRQLSTAGAVAETIARAPDIETGLTGMFTEIFRQCMEDGHWPRLFLEFVTMSRNEALRRMLAQYLVQVDTAVAELSRGLQQAGVVSREHDPNAMAKLLGSILNGMLMQWVVDPAQFDPRPWAGAFARILTQGVAPRHGE